MKPPTAGKETAIITPFNRTKVELKQGYKAGYKEAEKAFNRTKVELKLLSHRQLLLCIFPFNRTKVELKLNKVHHPDIRHIF